MGKKKKKELAAYEGYSDLLDSHRHPSAPERSHLRAGRNVPDDLILEIEDSGFYLGLETGFESGKGYYVGKRSDDDGNILVIGINGSGKSSKISKPSIEMWRDPMVVLDIKGELATHYARLYKKRIVTRPYIIFDPDKQGAWYDVFSLLRKGDPRLVQYVREIANALIPMPPDVRETYWINLARDLFSAAAIFFFNKGEGFIQTILAIQTTSVEKLCGIINSCGCNKAKMFLSEIGSLKPEHMASIGTELKRHTMVFATDEFIQAALSGEDGEIPFSWNDVARAEEPVNIFLCMSQDKLEQWSGVIRVMLTQLIRTLERRPEKRYGVQDPECQPVLILLDEFDSLGKMDFITGALTTLRSKNVTFCLMMQSLPQLDRTYGKETRQIIFDNCQYKAFLVVTEPDTQEYISKMFGTVTVGQRGISESRDLDTERISQGWNLQERREPLVYPHEFALNKDIWLYTLHGFTSTVKLPVTVTRLHIMDFDKRMNEYFNAEGRISV